MNIGEYVVAIDMGNPNKEVHVDGDYDELAISLFFGHVHVGTVLIAEKDIDRLYETIGRVIEFGKIGKEEQ